MKLCEKFARKASKHLKYQNWFCRDLHKPATRYTRAKNKKVKQEFLPVETRTDRFKKSPLPFLTEILNSKIM